MGLSRVEFISDGVQDTYSVTFALGYFKQSDVTCRVGDENVNRTIQFISPTLIKILGSIPPIGSKVVFERTVTATSLLVQYQNGDILNDENLTTDQKHALYLIHQALDGRVDTVIRDLDMHNYRIKNLGDPILDTDAVNKRWVNKLVASLMNFIPSVTSNGRVTPASFGAYGDGVHDDTVALQAMLDSPFKSFDWGNKVYRITNTLLGNQNGQVHYGDKALVVFDHSLTVYSIPQLILKPGATNNYWNGIEFEYDGYDVPQAFLSRELDLVLTDAVCVMGEGTVFENCRCYNAWGNGFAAGYFTWTGDGLTEATQFVISQTNFAPINIKFLDCNSYKAGSGYHYAPAWWPNVGTYVPGRQGVGINLLTASRCVVANCIDYQSQTGFAVDYGSGAVSNTFTGCIAINNKKDPALNITLASGGWGYWIGSPQTIMNGCIAVAPEGAGFVMSQYSERCVLSGCMTYISSQQGLIDAGKDNVFSGCIWYENGLEDFRLGTGFSFEGVELRSITVGEIRNRTFTGCYSGGTYQRYGIRCSGPGNASGVWVGGKLAGTISSVEIGNHGFLVQRQKNGVRNWGIGTLEEADINATLVVSGATGDVDTNPIGSALNGGTIVAQDRGNPAGKVAMGYDNINNTGVIAASNTVDVPLRVNPHGGHVQIGLNNWAFGILKLGTNNWMWISADGKLRVRTGAAPASDTDGIVVGTQS